MSILLAAISLGAIGLFFGVLLGFASKKFQVETDPKIPLIREILPGANCGGCGYPGCDAYAEAVVSGEANANLCSVGGQGVIEKIGEILGVEVEANEKQVAFVKCNGTCIVARDKYSASGVTNCFEAATLNDGGSKGCSAGCLGLGSCIKVCEFGAIDIIDGVAKIDDEKCINCGQCTKICPKGLIESFSQSQKVRVACSSNEFGKKVRENCTVGCIGCSICEKNCPSGAIKVKDKLAKVTKECTSCGICISKCPTKAIVILN